MSSSPAPAWLSTRAACERLGVPLWKLYALIDQGQLVCHQIGRVYRIAESEIDAYLAAKAAACVPRSAPASVFVVDPCGKQTSWARLALDGGQDSGADLDSLIEAVVSDLQDARPVALGLCSPMSIPIPPTTLGLGRARYGDVGPCWSAEGAVRLVTGLQTSAFILASIRARFPDRVLQAGVDSERFQAGDLDLLVWEAIDASGGPVDVVAAAREAVRRTTEHDFRSDVVEPVSVSLAGAAIGSAGLATSPTAGPPWTVRVKHRPNR